MGQQANNAGRQAKLDEQKQRAAGRRGRTGQDAPTRKAMADAGAGARVKGRAGGASGKTSEKVGAAPANRRDSSATTKNHLGTGRSSRPARKK